MKKKKCSRCKLEKNFNEFSKCNKSKQGIQSQCIDCKKDIYNENREKLKKYFKIYQENNREKLNKYNRLRYRRRKKVELNQFKNK